MLRVYNVGVAQHMQHLAYRSNEREKTMLHIDLLSRTPIYEQITAALEEYVLSGVLKAGDQVPSVRRISLDENINPRTVLKAYTELDARGIITAVPGKGYFVAPDAVARLTAGKREKLTVFRTLAEELASAGIAREELDAAIDEVYKSLPQWGKGDRDSGG